VNISSRRKKPRYAFPPLPGPLVCRGNGSRLHAENLRHDCLVVHICADLAESNCAVCGPMGGHQQRLARGKRLPAAPWGYAAGRRLALFRNHLAPEILVALTRL